MNVENTLAAIAYNIKFGGNNRVYDAAELYLTGAHVQGEESESIAAFNIARDLAVDAMRQIAITVQGDHGLTQTIDNQVLPEYDSNGQLVTPPCADIEQAIITSMALITTAINGGALGNKTLPVFTAVTRWLNQLLI